MNESDMRPETDDDESRPPAADEVAGPEPTATPTAAPSRRFYANLNDV